MTEDLIYMLLGFLFIPVLAIVFQLALGDRLAGHQTADPDCPHCRGLGYDASGYACTCVKEVDGKATG